MDYPVILFMLLVLPVWYDNQYDTNMYLAGRYLGLLYTRNEAKMLGQYGVPKWMPCCIPLSSNIYLILYYCTKLPD